MSVLSADEAAALRSEQQQVRPEKPVHPFELLNTEVRVRGRLSSVEIAAGKVAEQFGRVMTQLRKRPSTFFASPPTMVTARERDDRVSAYDVICVLKTESDNGSSGAAVLLLSPALVSEFVDRNFGGGLATKAAARGPVSALVAKLAAKLAERVVAELDASRGNAWPTVRFASVATKRDVVSIMLGKQPLLALGFTEEGTVDETPAFQLLLPSSALDAREGNERAPANATWQAELAAQITEAPVDLVFELGQASLTLDELLSLEPGRVVRLDRSAHDALTVRVLGEPVFEGTPGAEGAHVAFTVQRVRA